MKRPQLRDVSQILWSPGLTFQTNEAGQVYDTQRNTIGDLFGSGTFELPVEIEGLANKNVDRRLAMRVAVKVQHLHPLLVDPALSLLWISECVGVHGYPRQISEGGKRCKRVPDVFGCQLDDEVYVHREARVSVSVHGKPTNQNEPDPSIIQRPCNGLQTSDFQV
jgi:hypothetical protein